MKFISDSIKSGYCTECGEKLINYECPNGCFEDVQKKIPIKRKTNRYNQDYIEDSY